MSTISHHSQKPLRIGHRGAAGCAPENTLASLEMAISLGVDLVEFDVRRSADGGLVLIHDATVDRTTKGGQGSVAALPLSVLRGLDAGGGERIPLLEEALVCLNGRAGAMIELKVPGIATDVCVKVHAMSFQGTVIYASFFSEELLTVRTVIADAHTLALFEEEPTNPVTVVRDVRATHAGLAVGIVTSGIVQELQEQGIKVFVYTVDELQDIACMKRLGVDAIISNYPDRI